MQNLYFAPNSIALASLIALEEAGAEYQAVRVDFARNAQRGPDYLAINPKARVPSLVTDRGVLTETPALLAYIASVYPAAGLAPADPWEFARMQEFNAYLCSTVHVSHAHRPRGARWSDDPAIIEGMKVKVPENMRTGIALIEAALTGDWVMGSQYTVADPYLYTVAGFLKSDAVDIAEFPRVAAHTARMNQRPAVQRALALAV
jgi:glutathione S-transferase